MLASMSFDWSSDMPKAVHDWETKYTDQKNIKITTQKTSMKSVSIPFAGGRKNSMKLIVL